MEDDVRLAKDFHDLYEQLAPSFGYATRPDTKVFDPESQNGRLMRAVCSEIVARELKRLAAPGDRTIVVHRPCYRHLDTPLTIQTFSTIVIPRCMVCYPSSNGGGQ